MTLGVVAILVLAVVGFILLAHGMCNRNVDPMIFGCGFIIVAALAVMFRAASIDSDIRYELCVKEGKEIVEIFEQKVCKL